MNEKRDAMRYRHHFLINGAILTVCTKLIYETRDVQVGWSLFNPNDDRWIRKIGNFIAKERLIRCPITFSLTQDERIMCDYISIRALLLILNLSAGMHPSFDPDYDIDHPSSMHKDTLEAIQMEIINILSLLGQRVGLPSMVE